VNVSTYCEFEALLSRPSLHIISPPLRLALLEKWQQPDTDSSARAPWPVLLDTLDLLTQLAADEAVLVAALLFDLPGLCVYLPQFPLEAPNAVRDLLDGQHAADQVWAIHAGRKAGRNSEGLRRLLLSIVHDLRVVPILLARQLATLRRADRLPDQQRCALAQLTSDLHAPLANRLGIWQLKWELEDLTFRFLQPQTYQHIARYVDEHRSARERYVAWVKRSLERALKQHGISAQVSGRPKHIYSIWRKMQKKRLGFDQLYDLRALRVMVEDIAACYATLGVVHSLWMPIPSEFDDYIARPKANNYQSLHTVVIGPEGRSVEVQIRTHQMHTDAELGVAAHWKYKEGGKQSEQAFERRIAWMRQLLEPAADNHPPEDLAGALDAELSQERVYVLSPKGEVIDLPHGATVLDFAYHVHTMVGHRCRGAKVDGRIVPLTYRLRSGERVEILTTKQPNPRRAWLIPANGFLASSRSRSKVRNWFNKIDRASNIQAGREVLERELRRLGLLQADLNSVLPRLHVDSVEELYIRLALGDTGANQVSRALLEAEQPPPAPAITATPLRQRSTSTPKTGFTVQGVGNLLVQLAKCCQPVAGEPIAGYLTHNRGVSVHRSHCPAFARLAARRPERILSVEWGQTAAGFEVNIHIRALERRTLLKDITTVIAQENVNILSINSHMRPRNERMQLHLRLKVNDYDQLSTLLGKLDALPGVEHAQRVK